MKTIEALKEIAWQVSIEEFMDENERELIDRMRGYINVGHEELGLDAAVLGWTEDATDKQIITAINEYLKEVDEENWIDMAEEIKIKGWVARDEDGGLHFL